MTIKARRARGGAERKAHVPAALAKRAAAESAAKKARLAKQGADLIALVRRLRDRISDAFFDMGEALRELKKPDMVRACGAKSFAELCESKLGISVTVADQLVLVVASMSREDAVRMGQTKAMAMVALAKATPEDDTPASLFEAGRLALPHGKSLDVRTASTRAIEQAAKTIRQATRAAKPRRGRTTTADERALAAAAQRALRAAGLARAIVVAVATKPGEVSDLRIQHVPADRLSHLARALAALAKKLS